MKRRKSSLSTLPSTNRTVFSLSLIGVGLMIIGVAAFFLFSKTDRKVSANNLAVRPAELNRAAPDLTFRDLEGKLISLTDYRGQVILVNNWATWCPPCRAEMPVLEAYYQAHHQEGFVILAIEVGAPVEEVRAFVRQYGLSFPVLLDPEGHALAAFNNPALPNTHIIDREGRVRLAWTGAVNQKTLETFLTPLLKE